jgi:polyhydroxyalkanoate synthase subunit PhaE
VSADAWGGWQAFSEAARSYLDNMSKPSGQGAAAQFSDFLREQFATYSQPWGSQAPGAQPWAGAFATAPGGPSSASSPEVPAFGATREHQQRAQRIAQSMQRMEAAQRRLQRLWSDVLREASAKFVSQLPPAPPAATTPARLRKLYDIWIDCAEEAYAHVAHSEAFCQAQAEFANAASQWRLEQQASIEQWSKFLDLPTRSELNSLTRRLRAVEERLRALSEVAPAPSARPRAASLKRAKGKKKRS